MQPLGRRYEFTTPFVASCLLAVSFLCWISGYIGSLGFPIYEEVRAMPFWNAVCQYLQDKGMAYLVGAALMLACAFLIHRANYILILIREKTLLPVLLYLLFISTHSEFLPLRSTSLGTFFLILSVYFTFKTYHDIDNTHDPFNAALNLGIGSLFWAHILCFLPFVWYALYKFRSLTVRSFLATLLGVGVIHWLTLFYCLIQADYTLYEQLYNSFFFVPLDFTGYGWSHWLFILCLMGLTGLSAMNIFAHEYDDNLRTRDYLSVLIRIAFGAFALHFVYEQSAEEFLEITCFPSSILIAHYFTVVRNKLNLWLFYGVCIMLISIFLIEYGVFD